MTKSRILTRLKNQDFFSKYNNTNLQISGLSFPIAEAKLTLTKLRHLFIVNLTFCHFNPNCHI